MRITTLAVASLLATVAVAAQIIHPIPLFNFNGPGTRISPGSPPAKFDLDGDNLLDLTIFSYGIICTTDIPPTACSANIHLTPHNHAEILTKGNEIKLLPPGADIGPVPPADAQWRTNTVLLASLVSRRNSPWEWAGPLKEEDDAYIAIRLKSGDAWRYGWIHPRARSTQLIDGGVEILAWKIEDILDTPIQTPPAAVDPITVATSPRAGNLRLHWETVTNRAYRIQVNHTLNSSDWQNLEPVLIATGPILAIDVPLTGTNQFYRIVRADD